jgi:hypothetical protein
VVALRCEQAVEENSVWLWREAGLVVKAARAVNESEECDDRRLGDSVEATELGINNEADWRK